MLEVASFMQITQAFEEKLSFLFLKRLPRILAHFLHRLHQVRCLTSVLSGGTDFLRIPLDALNGLIETPELRFEQLKTIDLSLVLQIEGLHAFEDL